VLNHRCCNRRGVLAWLAALPAALGLAILSEPEIAGARKKRDTKRKRRGGGYSPDNEERKFLDLINDYRRRNSAGNLSLQNQLGAAAEAHSRDMARKNYFKHSNTKKIVERHGYRNWKFIGENIAAGDETAEQVFQSWKNSADHAKNMRSKHFTEIGIGRAYSKSSRYGWYWTTTFGDR
jgi:uncharacterized protein YkwD